MLQQYLPFTVLKPATVHLSSGLNSCVATVLTVYGIETVYIVGAVSSISYYVATVPTVYGIETFIY